MRNNQIGVETSNQNIITPLDLRDTITKNNLALRAFSALLRTSNLSDFSSQDTVFGSQGMREAEDLRCGLSQLIGLCLENQEQTLESYTEQYLESDEWLLKKATSLIGMADNGSWYPGNVPKAHIREALNNLETIISRDSVFKPKAEVMRATILQHHLPQTAQKSENALPTDHETIDQRDA